MKHPGKSRERAYLNAEFMNSSPARPLRILSEYLMPLEIFAQHDIRDTIVFFGSARAKAPAQLKKAVAEARATARNELDYLKIENMQKLSGYYRQAVLLSFMLTRWSKSLPRKSRRFLIASGGGPGIMEASNRGASMAKGISVGLNIDLPFEQTPNPYITDWLSFDFNYFFMRKYWFMYLAKALVIFPGGFGTMDEFFELITLVQTRKITKPLPIVLLGEEFWKKAINFQTFIEWGVIHENDLKYIYFAESVDDAFNFMVENLTELYLRPEAKS